MKTAWICIHVSVNVVKFVNLTISFYL